MDLRNGNARMLMLLALVAMLAAMPFAWDYATRYDGTKQWRVFVFREVVYAMAIGTCGYLAYATVLQAQAWSLKFAGKNSSPE